MTTTEERFWSHVDKNGPIHPYDPAHGPCWLWKGSKTIFGYGNITIDHETVLAHRWIWQHDHGPLPKGIEVCHSCDRPGCVRHLFTGTHGDNIRDCFRKGRANRCSGERHWSKTHRQEAARNFGEVNVATRAPECMARGERNGNAKLTTNLVLEVVRLRKTGLSQAKIGATLGLTRESVSDVCQGKTWRHVTGLTYTPRQKCPADAGYVPKRPNAEARDS